MNDEREFRYKKSAISFLVFQNLKYKNEVSFSPTRRAYKSSIAQNIYLKISEDLYSMFFSFSFLFLMEDNMIKKLGFFPQEAITCRGMVSNIILLLYYLGSISE